MVVHQRVVLFTLFTCILFYYGCKKKELNQVKVQFINSSMHAPYLDYYLQGTKRAEFIGYTLCSNSHTADLVEGEPLTIEVKNPATNSTLFSASYADWKPNWHYTLVIYDDYANPKFTLLRDSVSWPDPGQFKVRFMHFSPEAPALDLFFNADTAGFNKIFFATDSTNAVDTLYTLPAATYTVTLKNHFSGLTYISLPNIGIADNRILDIYATGTFSDSLTAPLVLGWAAH